MLIKIVFIIFAKYGLVMSKNCNYFWKKKINFKLLFFSKDFVNKFFFTRKYYYVFNNAKNVYRVWNNPRKLRRYYKVKKGLPGAFAKKSRYVSDKNLGKSDKKRYVFRSFKNFTKKSWLKARRAIIYQNGQPPRRKYYIITKGWRKGQRQYMRKRRKYYFAHKRYAPQFLTRGEVVYEKLRKTVWSSLYRENRAKSFYYFIENKKRGISKHYKRQRLLRLFKRAFKKERAVKELTPVLFSINEFGANYKLFKWVLKKSRFFSSNKNLNDLNSLLYLNEDLVLFQRRSNIIKFKFFLFTRDFNSKKMIKFYLKNITQSSNFFSYKRFMNNFKKSLIYKKTHFVSYAINFKRFKISNLYTSVFSHSFNKKYLSNKSFYPAGFNFRLKKQKFSKNTLRAHKLKKYNTGYKINSNVSKLASFLYNRKFNKFSPLKTFYVLNYKNFLKKNLKFYYNMVKIRKTSRKNKLFFFKRYNDRFLLDKKSINNVTSLNYNSVNFLKLYLKLQYFNKFFFNNFNKNSLLFRNYQNKTKNFYSTFENNKNFCFIKKKVVLKSDNLKKEYLHERFLRKINFYNYRKNIEFNRKKLFVFSFKAFDYIKFKSKLLPTPILASKTFYDAYAKNLKKLNRLNVIYRLRKFKKNRRISRLPTSFFSTAKIIFDKNSRIKKYLSVHNQKIIKSRLNRALYKKKIYNSKFSNNNFKILDNLLGLKKNNNFNFKQILTNLYSTFIRLKNRHWKAISFKSWNRRRTYNFIDSCAIRRLKLKSAGKLTRKLNHKLKRGLRKYIKRIKLSRYKKKSLRYRYFRKTNKKIMEFNLGKLMRYNEKSHRVKFSKNYYIRPKKLNSKQKTSLSNKKKRSSIYFSAFSNGNKKKEWPALPIFIEKSGIFRKKIIKYWALKKSRLTKKSKKSKYYSAKRKPFIFKKLKLLIKRHNNIIYNIKKNSLKKTKTVRFIKQLKNSKFTKKKIKFKVLNDFSSKRMKSSIRLKKKHFNLYKNLKLNGFFFDARALKKNKFFSRFNIFSTPVYYKNYPFFYRRLKQFSNQKFIKNSKTKTLFFNVSYAKAHLSDSYYSWIANNSIGYRLARIDKMFINLKRDIIKNNESRTINFFLQNYANLNSIFNSFKSPNKTNLFKSYFKKLAFINARRHLNFLIANKLNILNSFGIMTAFKLKFFKDLKLKKFKNFLPKNILKFTRKSFLSRNRLTSLSFFALRRLKFKKLKFKKRVRGKLYRFFNFNKKDKKFIRSHVLKKKDVLRDQILLNSSNFSLVKKDKFITKKKIKTLIKKSKNKKLSIFSIPNFFNLNLVEFNKLMKPVKLKKKCSLFNKFFIKTRPLKKSKLKNFSEKNAFVLQYKPKYFISAFKKEFNEPFVLGKLRKICVEKKKSTDYNETIESSEIFDSTNFNELNEPDETKLDANEMGRGSRNCIIYKQYVKNKFEKLFKQAFPTRFVDKKSNYISEDFFFEDVVFDIKFSGSLIKNLKKVFYNKLANIDRLDVPREIEQEKYKLKRPELFELSNDFISFDYHFARSNKFFFNAKLYNNSLLKRSWKIKKKTLRKKPFRDLETDHLGWIFPSRRVYSSFFRSYNASKKTGFFRHLFKNIYIENSKSRLSDFTNGKNVFLRNKIKLNISLFKYFISNENALKKSKGPYILKKKFFKKKFYDVSAFNLNIIRMQNKKIIRYNRYKNSICYHIFSKKHKLVFRKPSINAKKVKNFIFFNRILTPEIVSVDSSTKYRKDSTLEKKRKIFTYFKNNTAAQPVDFLNWYHDYSDYSSSNSGPLFVKGFFSSLHYNRKFIESFPARTVKEYINMFKKGPRSVLMNKYHFLSFLKKKSKPLNVIKKNKIKVDKRKLADIYKKGENYNYFFRRRRPHVKNSRFYNYYSKKKKRFDGLIFKKSKVKYIYLFKRKKKIKPALKNVFAYSRKKFMKKKIVFVFKKKKRIFNIYKKLLILKKNAFKKVAKKKFVFYFKRNSVFSNNFFYAKNVQKIFKKNKLFKESVNLVLKDLYYVTSLNFRHNWASKFYLEDILARLPISKFNWFFKPTLLKKFVFNLFVLLQKGKKILLRTKKKRIKNVFSKAKRYGRYFKVILKRTKWVYCIALFDYNNVMLMHFNYISLNIKFSKKIRINFYKVWHKMIFKFYVACLKNKILHLSEVYYYKRYRRKNKIKLSWVKMFIRQYEKAFRHPLHVKPIRINKVSFSKKTTKNKKIRR